MHFFHIIITMRGPGFPLVYAFVVVQLPPHQRQLLFWILRRRPLTLRAFLIPFGHLVSLASSPANSVSGTSLSITIINKS